MFKKTPKDTTGKEMIGAIHFKHRHNFLFVSQYIFKTIYVEVAYSSFIYNKDKTVNLII